LGEHLLCKQGVVGSIPISSTSLGEWPDGRAGMAFRFMDYRPSTPQNVTARISGESIEAMSSAPVFAIGSSLTIEYGL
jgi:hypothetical protein